MNLMTRNVFLFFLMVTSCTSKEKEELNRTGYIITGQVKNIPATRIFMNTMVLDSAGQPKWPVIDSADYNGETFILKRDTLLAEPAWATEIFYIDSITKTLADLAFNNKYLSTKEKPSKFAGFILENAAIQIQGDIKNKNGLKMRGSKETDFNFQYGLMQPPYTIHALNQKIDAAMQTPDTSLSASYRIEKHNLMQAYKASFKNIIRDHPSYFESLFNIYNNADVFTPGELQTLIGILDKKLLLLPTGKKLIEFAEKGRRLLPRDSFPDFTYMDTTGKKTTLDDVKGKYGTLIIFWASWCGPCRQEIPELKELYNQYNSKGISLVSISLDNSFTAWKKALLKEQMPWQNLSNLPGYYAEIYSKYNIKAIPLMFLLDKNKNILLANPQTIEEIKSRLNQ